MRSGRAGPMVAEYLRVWRNSEQAARERQLLPHLDEDENLVQLDLEALGEGAFKALGSKAFCQVIHYQQNVQDRGERIAGVLPLMAGMYSLRKVACIVQAVEENEMLLADVSA